MMPERLPERLTELLAVRALSGLSPDEARELDELLVGHPELRERHDEVALEALALQPLPPALRDRLLREAGRVSPSRPRRWAGLPWWAMAAVLSASVWLATVWLATWESPETLLNRHPQTRRARWQGAFIGEVVWNPALQSGYLRLAGLAINDTRRSVYQLWIFDARRDQRYPVDGGVFDIARHGEVRVPIHPGLPVSAATAFAITEEAPGGVVVSDRQHLVAMAKLE